MIPPLDLPWWERLGLGLAVAVLAWMILGVLFASIAGGRFARMRHGDDELL